MRFQDAEGAMPDPLPTGLPSMTLAEAGRMVRAGETSFAELTRLCLDRAAETSGLNAFERVFETEAMVAAGAQDALLGAGYDLGPLQGIAIALKSNIAIRGVALTAGSRLLADRIAIRDAEVTRRLRRAGAVILGTTNMHEFAWGGTTANPHYGQARNARDPERIPAGSSGGSGAAVASGAVFAALGTDTGGSVRLPAGMNGITGLRPGIGRLPVDGIFPLAWSLDTVGPMARNGRDAAALLAAMLDQPFLPSARRDWRGLRIGVPRGYVFERIEEGVGAAFSRWLDAVRAAGAEPVDIEIDALERAVDALVIVDAAEPTAVHDGWLDISPELYGKDVLNQLLAGRAITATEYLHAQRFRTVFRETVLALLAQVDVIATPTIPFVAPLIGQTEVILSGRPESALTANMRFTAIASCSGLPAVSFPCPGGAGGLPVGIQLIGRDGSEAGLLALAD
ncbi:amidase [Pseudogemmobacter sonorensis]|uniref:amidase n=1 Tax=Pseudogemmobacter sonorensis TaxID=2989681 RepID=UPI0036B1D97A